MQVSKRSDTLLLNAPAGCHCFEAGYMSTPQDAPPSSLQERQMDTQHPAQHQDDPSSILATSNKSMSAACTEIAAARPPKCAAAVALLQGIPAEHGLCWWCWLWWWHGVWQG